VDSPKDSKGQKLGGKFLRPGILGKGGLLPSLKLDQVFQGLGAGKFNWFLLEGINGV